MLEALIAVAVALGGLGGLAPGIRAIHAHNYQRCLKNIAQLEIAVGFADAPSTMATEYLRRYSEAVTNGRWQTARASDGRDVYGWTARDWQQYRKARDRFNRGQGKIPPR